MEEPAGTAESSTGGGHNVESPSRCQHRAKHSTYHVLPKASILGEAKGQSGYELSPGLDGSNPTLGVCPVTQFSCHICEMGIEELTLKEHFNVSAPCIVLKALHTSRYEEGAQT